MDIPIARSCPQTAKVRVRNFWFHLATIEAPESHHLFSSPPVDCDNPKPTKFDPKAKRLIGIRNATSLAGCSSRTLSNLWHSGQVSQHVLGHGEREVIAFDRDQLHELNQNWQERIKLDSLGFALGISQFGVEQLVAMDLLKADAMTVPGSGLVFTQSSRSELLTRIWDMRASSVVDPVTLKSVLHGIGGRPKPWGPIIRCLLDGAIEFCVDPTCTDAQHMMPLTTKILITRAAAPVIHRLEFDRSAYPSASFSETVIQRDVFEWLNGTGKIKPLLKHLKTSGFMPLRYQYQDVEQLAHEVATIPEVAYFLERDPADVFWMLKHAKIPQPYPKGWCRQALRENGFLSR